jgi:5-methylcytosine-specific restriction endonuclease McrA
MNIEIRNCKNHGLTDFVKRNDGHYRCKKCAVDAVVKRRIILKEKAIEYKGGACQECGYNKSTRALEFHHLDPNKKDFGISASGYTRSWEKVKEELNKCVMLCANCHAEKHEEIENVKKGLIE